MFRLGIFVQTVSTHISELRNYPQDNFEYINEADNNNEISAWRLWQTHTKIAIFR